MTGAKYGGKIIMIADIQKQRLVIPGYIIIAIVTTYPLILNLSSLLGPAEDNQMFIWNLWWFKYSIFDLGTSPFYTHYLFFPEGANLLFHTFSPLNNVFALILAPLFGYIISYNLLILFTFIIGAYGAFLLARQLGIGYEASFIAGVVYSFCPFHFAHAAHHLNISSIQFLPLLLYFAIKACQTRKFKFIIISSLLLAANFYLDYYIFLFSIFLLIPLLFFRFNENPNSKRRWQVKPLLIILVAGIVLTAPLAIPMLKESLSGKFEQTLGYNIFVADLIGFIFPHAHHWTKFLDISNTINSTYVGNYWESAVFLGYAVLIMAVWAICKKKFRLKNYFIFTGALGAVLALGLYPHLLGKAISFLKLPYYIISYVPGLNAARSPGRFVILTYLALAIFAAVAADSWIRYITDHRGKKAGIILFAVLVMAVIADYWSAPLAMTKIESAGFYQEIKSQKGDFAVMNIPAKSRDTALRYMYYQTIHHKPICVGQLARSEKLIQDYIKRWRGVEITIQNLKERKIKYIILHAEFMPPSTYADYSKRLKSGFAFIAEENGMALFQVY
jgi:hypothetical protein